MHGLKVNQKKPRNLRVGNGLDSRGKLLRDVLPTKHEKTAGRIPWHREQIFYTPAPQALAVQRHQTTTALHQF